LGGSFLQVSAAGNAGVGRISSKQPVYGKKKNLQKEESAKAEERNAQKGEAGLIVSYLTGRGKKVSRKKKT